MFFCIAKNIKRKNLNLHLQEIVASTCMYVFKKTHALPWLFCSFKILDFFMGGKVFTYKEGWYHILQMEGLLNIKKETLKKLRIKTWQQIAFIKQKVPTFKFSLGWWYFLYCLFYRWVDLTMKQRSIMELFFHKWTNFPMSQRNIMELFFPKWIDFPKKQRHVMEVFKKKTSRPPHKTKESWSFLFNFASEKNK